MRGTTDKGEIARRRREAASWKRKKDEARTCDELAAEVASLRKELREERKRCWEVMVHAHSETEFVKVQDRELVRVHEEHTKSRKAMVTSFREYALSLLVYTDQARLLLARRGADAKDDVEVQLAERALGRVFEQRPPEAMIETSVPWTHAFSAGLLTVTVGALAYMLYGAKAAKK